MASTAVVIISKNAAPDKVVRVFSDCVRAHIQRYMPFTSGNGGGCAWAHVALA